MDLPIELPLAPMLAAPEREIPSGDGWLYEPKWDGFRALVYRDGEAVSIISRNGQPMERYFPELLPVLRESLPPRAVVDGEIVVAAEQGLDFDALLQRIHPAASRVALLAAQTPATYIAFDLLALGDEDLLKTAQSHRRGLLLRHLRPSPQCFPTPVTEDRAEAQRWFERFEGAGLDGIIAKRADMPYRPGQRVMVKVKHQRTADFVVGGYRLSKGGDGIGSLLLGLYDEQGVLHYVGHTSSFKARERQELLARMLELGPGESFGPGRTPGGPSRWARGRDVSWTAVKPSLTCEAGFDRLRGDRLRHAATFIRWRPDKDPKACDFDQLVPPEPFSLEEVRGLTS